MNLSSLSSGFLLVAFILYNVGFFMFVIAITGKRWSRRDPQIHTKQWGWAALIVAVAAFVCHLTFFFTRWYSGGHIPISNLYEFMTFLGMMIMAAFIVVYLIYRAPVLGIFALPVGVIILAYAAVFPHEVEPLIPALQSYWLKIHVTTAATGEAFFAVGFAGGLMYLLRSIDFTDSSKSSRKEQRGLEFTLFIILMIITFAVTTFAFNAAGYHAQFSTQTTVVDQAGNNQVITQKTEYVLPPIVKPHNSTLDEMQPFLGISAPLFEAPDWMKGVNAGRKFNTVLWSILSALIIYLVLRLVMRKSLGRAIHPVMHDIDPQDLDEISYRAIAIGYPIFTLGALIFAMIWAQEAWGTFWSWDPKEVWALIVWLFYAAFLHLRISRGWQGKKSAWLAVIGFVIVMITLIGVNLVIAGLHSYAGVS